MSVIAQLRKQYPNLQNMTDDQIIDYTAASNNVKPGSQQYDQLRQYMGGYDRSWGDVAEDTGIGLAQGVLSAGKGVAELGGLVLPGVNAYDNPVVNKLNAASQYLGQYESPGLRNQRASAEVAHNIAEQNAQAQGKGGVGQFLSGAGATLGSYLEHPGLIGQFVAENAAQFVPIGAAGRTAKWGADLVGAGERAAQIGTGAAVATGAGLQGAQTADQTYQELVLHGVPPEQAARMATGAGAKSALVSGGLAMLPFGRAIEQRLAGNAVSGYGLGGVGRTLATTGVESATEGADEGYGQYAQNQAIRQVDPTVSPWRGVGQAAVQGAVASGPFGLWAGATGGHGHVPAHTEDGNVDLTNSATEDATQAVASPLNGSTGAQPPAAQRNARILDLPPAVRAKLPDGFDPSTMNVSVDGGTVVVWPKSPEEIAAQREDSTPLQRAGLNLPPAIRRAAEDRARAAAQASASFVGPQDQSAAMATNEVGPQAPGRFIGPVQPTPPSFIDLANVAQPVQQTPASFVDMASGRYSQPQPDPLEVMAGQSITSGVPPTNPPSPPPAAPAAPAGPTTQAGTGVMTGTPEGDVIPPQTPEAMAAIQVARAAQRRQNVAAGGRPSVGQLLASLNTANAEVNGRVVRRDGQVADTKAAAPIKAIINADDPVAAMRSLYENGAGPKDQLLDAWHQALTGRTIDQAAAQPESQPAVPPVDKQAGFVPEPAQQVSAQVDAVRAGRKAAVVMTVTQAKTVRLDGLTTATLTDPKTRKRAVLASADPAVVARATKRVKQVGLKQAMGEALEYANPKLTTEPSPDAAVVQQRDNATGQVIDEQAVTPQDVTKVKPVPGTTARVVPMEQALAERTQAAQAEPVNDVNSVPVKATKVPKLGRKTVPELVETANTTKDQGALDAAEYELYKRWRNTGDEQATDYFLQDAKGSNEGAKMASFTNSARGRELQKRYTEDQNAGSAQRGQTLGRKFDASVKQPVESLGRDDGSDGSNIGSEGAINDPYDHIETRPGTTDQQRATGRAALDALMARVRSSGDSDTSSTGPRDHQTDRLEQAGPDSLPRRPTDSGVARADAVSSRVLGRRNAGAGEMPARVLGIRLIDGFEAAGVNQLVGQRVSSPADLAAVAQVYRDPRFETFRVVYTDADGVVAGEAGYTSRLPGSTSLPENFPDLVAADKARFGANDFYIIHNHPDGVSEPSPDDISTTRLIAEEIPGFRSHVVIDHNEYTVISADGGTQTISAPELDGVDFAASPALDHPLIGQRLRTVEDTVNVAKQLQTPQGYATLVALDAHRHINLIADIPMKMVLDGSRNGQRRLAAMIGHATREAGAAGHRFLVTPEGVDIGYALAPAMRGVVFDIVNASGQTATRQGFRPRDDYFETHSRSTRVAQAVEQLEDHPFTTPFSNAAKSVTAAVRANATGKDVSKTLLSTMTLRQIVEQFGKKLPALQHWANAMQQRGAAAGKLASAADRVAQEWESKVKAGERKALNDVLLGASAAQVDLDNTSREYVDSLNAPDRAEYARLRAQLLKLSPEAQGIRHKVLDVLNQQWQYTHQALRKFITETVPNPEDRARRLKELDEAMGHNRGNYFPLSRFGDTVVIGRGAGANNTDVVTFHESAASAEREVNRLKAAGVKKVDVSKRVTRDPRERPTVGLIGSLHAAVDSSMADTAAKEGLHEAIQEIYLRALPEMSGAKNLIRRRTVEGYDEDALRVFADAVTRGGHYAAHLEYAPEIRAAMESAQNQVSTGANRTVAVLIGRKAGTDPVVRITPVGVDRLHAAAELADQGYTTEFFNGPPEAVRSRLDSALEGADPSTLDKYEAQAEALAGRQEEGVEDSRAAVTLYNHMMALQASMNRPHGGLDALVDTLGQVGYTWYLGVTPAFWLMNTLQNPMIGIPHLGGKYGMAKATTEWIRAMKWFTGTRLGKYFKDAKTPFSVQWLRDEVADGRLKGITKDELDMLGTLEDRQVLDFTRAMDLARIGDASNKTWHKAMKFAAAGAHHTEVFNRVTFALAAYRLALKSGANVTHAEAVRRAEADVAAAHFDYSNPNKPLLMRGTAARAVFMFQQYRQHMLYWWAKTVKDMVKGETPETRRQARKAALLMAMAQGTFAGALGLPFVGTLGLLASAFSGDDDDEPFDLQKWVQDAATEVTGSAKAGEVLSKGIFAAFGMDISKRIGQADLLPMLNQQGSWQYATTKADSMRDYLLDMLGPLGSIAVGMAKGGDLFAHGNTLGGIAAMTPKAVADLTRAYQMGSEGLKNSRGQTLATSEAFDGADWMMQAAGVTPLTKSEIQSDRGRVLDAENFYKDRSSRLTQAFIEAWKNQDHDGMAEAVGDIEKYNQSLGKKGLASKSFVITGGKLESAIRDQQRKAMMLALTGGTAQTRRQLLLATRMSGLYNPVTMAAMQQHANAANGLPGLPGLPR